MGAVSNFENISDRECSMIFECYIHHLMALLHDSYVRFQDTLMYKTVKKKILKQMKYEMQRQQPCSEEDESVTKQLETMLTPSAEEMIEEDHSGQDTTLTDIATLVTTVDDQVYLHVNSNSQITKSSEMSNSDSVSKCRHDKCECTRFVKRSTG